MGTCREIFFFIQQKLAEKTHSGRITITRGRISVFFGHRQETIFSWVVALSTLISCTLSLVRPTSDISLNLPRYIFTEN